MHRSTLERLAQSYPSPSTCWRRLRDWEEQNVWLKAWCAFWGQLDAEGQLDWSEAFAGGSFALAKKGEPALGKRNGAKARSGWWWSTAKVFLITMHRAFFHVACLLITLKKL